MSGYVAIHRWNAQEATGSSLADSGGGTAAPLAVGPTMTLNAGVLPGFAASVNQAVEYEDAAAFLSTAGVPSGMASGNWLIALWWLPVGSAADAVVAYGDASHGPLLYANSGAWALNLADASAIGGAFGAWVTGTWYRIAMWTPPYGSSGTPRIWINGGVPFTPGAVTFTAGSADTLRLGKDWTGGVTYSKTQVSRIKVYACGAADANLVAVTDYAGQIGVIPN